MLNKCMLQGRMCADPEIKKTQTGNSVVSFTIGIDRNYKVDGVYPTDFINCTAWRSCADLIGKHFRKGDTILLEGSIQTHSFTTQEGQKRKITDISVDRVHFPGSMKGSRNGANSGEIPYTRGDADDSEFMSGNNLPPIPGVSDFTDVDDDELPF